MVGGSVCVLAQGLAAFRAERFAACFADAGARVGAELVKWHGGLSMGGEIGENNAYDYKCDYRCFCGPLCLIVPDLAVECALARTGF